MDKNSINSVLAFNETKQMFGSVCGAKVTVYDDLRTGMLGEPSGRVKRG